jgi:ABC-2 type transport system ATP-binding protein
MSLNEPVLQLHSVSKVYPARPGREALTAVQDVSFNLARGEILALLGPNGAGKTTTLKMVSGLLRPSSGHILIGTEDVAKHRSRAVKRLGAVLEGNRNLHWKLTALENLRYFGALKGVNDLERRSQEVVARLDLGEHLKKRVGELSRGLQQRVAIAIALINEPQVLLLDEPTLGLDVIAATSFKDIVRTIADAGCGIVLTTHQMEVAQELSDRVAIIARGRMAVMESLADLMKTYRTPGYEITWRGTLDADARGHLAAMGVQVPTTASGKLGVPEGQAELLYAAIETLRVAGVELVGVQQQEVNLEDIYRNVVGGHQ